MYMYTACEASTVVSLLSLGENKFFIALQVLAFKKKKPVGRSASAVAYIYADFSSYCTSIKIFPVLPVNCQIEFKLRLLSHSVYCFQ